MPNYSRSHLADHVLLRTLTAVLTQDRVTTAELLALMAEVDRRGLFRGEGYPSMFKYCVGKLGMSEDMAYKRIQAARVARRFASVLPAIADGRLHLTAVVLLKPRLTKANADDLLAAASGKSKAQVELLIAERFPQPDVETSLLAVAPLAPHPVPELTNGERRLEAAPLAPRPQLIATPESELVPEPVVPTIAAPPAGVTSSSVPPSRVAPLSPGRFELRLTISQSLHDKLRRAQELLSHALPSGDIPALLERALDELIAKQEKAQFAATDKPRARRKRSKNPRHVPAAVKRHVRTRDQGRCTFVSDDGHRCEARKFLQYDHVQPVARGGEATADNLRLRCRAHNQLEAERVYGAAFMAGRRNQAMTPFTRRTQRSA